VIQRGHFCAGAAVVFLSFFSASLIGVTSEDLGFPDRLSFLCGSTKRRAGTSSDPTTGKGTAPTGR